MDLGSSVPSTPGQSLLLACAQNQQVSLDTMKGKGGKGWSPGGWVQKGCKGGKDTKGKGDKGKGKGATMENGKVAPSMGSASNVVSMAIAR